MITPRKAIIAAVTATGLALGLAPPAGADSVDSSCPLAVTFLCNFLPIAPDLDHDLDLTQQSGTINGQPVPEMPTGATTPDNGG
ncbi:MAG: fibronectin-binding protein [Mycobacterium sp.]